MPMIMIVPIVLLCSTLTHAAGIRGARQSDSDAPTPRWQHVTTWVRCQSEQLAADLEEAHGVLLARARVEEPSLVLRLKPAPPRPLPRGYGVLPAIRANQPLKRMQAREWVYSLERLSRGFTTDFLGGAQLAGRVLAEGDLALEPSVVEFERLRRSLRNIEDHLSYHEWWQGAIGDDPAYFEGRNAIIAEVRELMALRKRGEDLGRQQVLSARIRDAVAPFKSSNLEIQPAVDGGWRLHVRVQTDVRDENFLMAFAEGVEEAWNNAPPMVDRGLRIDLELVRVDPGTLYPESVPRDESAIDLKLHVARFPKGTMVLTTGADSTHAWTGRSVLLGPAPVTRRTLAHEFGHLLGFNDAYLRGFDGEVGGEFGVTVIEWRGLLDDLMGNPSAGAVSPEMVEQLFEAYGSD